MSAIGLNTQNIENYFNLNPVKSYLITFVVISILAGITYLGFFVSNQYFMEYAPAALLIYCALHGASRYGASKHGDEKIQVHDNVSKSVSSSIVVPPTTVLSPTPTISLPLPMQPIVVPTSSSRTTTVLPTLPLMVPLSTQPTASSTPTTTVAAPIPRRVEASGATWQVVRRPLQDGSYEMGCKLYEGNHRHLMVPFTNEMTILQFKGQVVDAWRKMAPHSGFTAPQLRVICAGNLLDEGRTCRDYELIRLECLHIVVNKTGLILNPEYFSTVDLEFIDAVMIAMDSFVDRRCRGKDKEVVALDNASLLLNTRRALRAIEKIQAAQRTQPADTEFQKNTTNYIAALTMLRNYIHEEVLKPSGMEDPARGEALIPEAEIEPPPVATPAASSVANSLTNSGDVSSGPLCDLSIKTSQGTTINVGGIPANAKIGFLRQRVESEIGETRGLLFAGQPMNDNLTLLHYGVQSQSTIHALKKR